MNDKRKQNIIIVGIALCAAVAIIAVIKLASIGKDYKKADDIYEETAEKYTETNEDGKWYEMIDVDFDGLHKINDEIIAWLYFENEDISYPILRSEDNEKYFRTTYDGKNASAGSIFMESSNEPDMTDLHTILYGHNMKNLSMFGKLKYYKQDANYYDGHEYFQIITPNTKYRCKIFSYKDVAHDSDFYTIYRPCVCDFSTFVNDKIVSGSLLEEKKADIEIADDSHVISLSTCTADDDTRFVVSALRIEEHSNEKANDDHRDDE